MIYEAVAAPTQEPEILLYSNKRFPTRLPSARCAQPLGIQIARVQHIGARSHGVAITFTDVRSIELLPSCNGKLDKKKRKTTKKRKKKKQEKRGEREKERGREDVHRGN